MGAEPDVIEGTAVEEHPPPEPAAEHQPVAAPPPSQDLIARPVGSTELIHAATPGERVEQATAVATALDSVIRAQGMRTKVGSQKKINPATGEPEKDGNGREVWVPRWHVNVEGWQTLATLLGLAVVPLEPTPVRNPVTGEAEKVSFEVHERTYHSKSQGGGLKAERRYTVEGYSWRCRCEVYKDGVLIGAGESVCSRTEQRWKEADDYAVMGMAQTRATSRAIAAAARWIVTLAGYSATPAEEMPADAAQEPPSAAPAAESELPVWAREASKERKTMLLDALAPLVGGRAKATQIMVSVKESLDVVPDVLVAFARALAAASGQPAPAPAAAPAEQGTLSEQLGGQQPASAIHGEPEPPPAQPAPEQPPYPEGAAAWRDAPAQAQRWCPKGLTAEQDCGDATCPVHGIPF